MVLLKCVALVEELDECEDGREVEVDQGVVKGFLLEGHGYDAHGVGEDAEHKVIGVAFA
jgi:hypothetical protein